MLRFAILLAAVLALHFLECDDSLSKMLTNFKCYYCHESGIDGDAILRHTKAEHTGVEVALLYGGAIKSTGKRQYRSFKFGITTEELNDNFSFDERTMKISAFNSDLGTTSADSPHAANIVKVRREKTPMKDVHCKKELFGHHCNDSEDNALNEEADSDSRVEEEIRMLLPRVLEEIRKSGRLSDWVSFHRQLAGGRFPTENISFQLFMDVARFIELDNICGMRYNDDVKQFWAVCYRLFRGKFIRLMGGLKCSGLSNGRDVDPSAAEINFVAPSTNTLRTELRKIENTCDFPGILHKNIDNFSKYMENKKSSCKLCFDGKKIASGFGQRLGEVDMFGNEEKPTKEDKSRRLKEENAVFDEINKLLDVIEESGVERLGMEESADVTLLEDICALTALLRKAPHILGSRIGELRKLKVKKQLLHDRLLADVNGKSWKDSKLSYAISAVKTFLQRVGVILENTLDAIDGLGEVNAIISGFGNIFVKGTEVDLNNQANYSCLLEHSDELEEKNKMPVDVFCQLIPQRTKKWLEIRERAKITGSTLNNALGLSTVKKQQEHYDIVYRGKPKPEPTAHIRSCMDYGQEHEIDAVGTIVGKILPSLCPEIVFYEEGCYIQRHDGEVFMVVSPDGSGRLGEGREIAFEIKCPIPGKMYTTDVHYRIPKYYVTQILAEMAVLCTKKLFYVSFSKNSTTVILAHFDESLWREMIDYAEQVYGRDCHRRPQGKTEESKHISELIDLYLEQKTEFIGEFRSCVSKKCRCVAVDSQRKATRGYHQSKTCYSIDIESIRTKCLKAQDALMSLHDISRLPAKEVIVFMLSDMDRIKMNDFPHAVPVAYGLSGYSLGMGAMRSTVLSVISECLKKNIDIVAVSSDGQFNNLSVRDHDDKPLTILQLARDTWNESKKVSKAQQVKELMSTNKVPRLKTLDDVITHVDMQITLVKTNIGLSIKGPICIGGLKSAAWKQLLTPASISTLIQKGSSASVDLIEPTGVASEDHIMPLLSEEIQESLDDSTLTKIKEINRLISDSKNLKHILEQSPDLTGTQHMDVTTHANDNFRMSQNDPVRSASEVPMDDGEFGINNRTEIADKEYDMMLTELKKIGEGTKKGKNKWTKINTTQMKVIMDDSKAISKKMTKSEIIACLKILKGCSINGKSAQSLSKAELVKTIASEVGISPLKVFKSPPDLQSIIRNLLTKQYPKTATNAIFAANLFPQKLKDWRRNCSKTFNWEVTIGGMREAYVFYSFPQTFGNVEHDIFYLLDCHHIYVNVRCLICRKGIPERGLYRQSWLDVAKLGTTNLSSAIVEDVIDPQSNAVAQIVFSENVEDKLEKLGHTKEANFCGIIRRWYEAEDSAGISAEERVRRRLDMREWLLQDVNFSDFPPQGPFIKGVTQVQFEGILTNIDRRIQMFSIAKSGCYNVRAPSTLDSENFFSAFQELDANNSGVLMADDIPRALGAASYILDAKVDSTRSFSMNTSKRPSAYVTHTVGRELCDYSDLNATGSTGQRITRITPRDHQFDQLDSKRQKRRKNAVVSSVDAPFKGVRGIREFHKKDESKILHHKLANMNL